MSTKEHDKPGRERGLQPKWWTARLAVVTFGCLICTLSMCLHSALAAEPIASYIVDSSHGDFVGTFALSSLPLPLQECWVDLSLTYAPKVPGTILPEGFTFYIWGSDEAISLVGDTVLSFAGQARAGYQTTARFGFIPRISRTSWIIVSPVPPAQLTGKALGPRFEICLDEEGELHYLNSPSEGERVSCGHLRTYFLESGQQSLTMKYPDQHVWSCTFSPVPRAGDTCEVVFRITPNIDWISGATIDLTAGGFLVPSLPKPVGGHITAGTDFELAFPLVPDSAMGEKTVRLLLFPQAENFGVSPPRNVIQAEVYFWFDADGSLQYVDTRPISVPRSKLAMKNADARHPGLEKYKISPDGELLFRRGGARIPVSSNE